MMPDHDRSDDDELDHDAIERALQHLYRAHEMRRKRAASARLNTVRMRLGLTSTDATSPDGAAPHDDDDKQR